MATTLASLSIVMDANSARMRAGLTDAEKGIKRVRKQSYQAKEAFDSMGKASDNAASGLTVIKKSASMARSAVNTLVGAITAVGVETVRQFRSVSEVSKFADQLGITTQRLLELSGVFEKHTNISADNFADSLKELNVRLGEAAITGGGPLVEAFEAIGLKVEDIRKLKTDEMVLRIADAFEVLDDKQTLAFVSEELFAGEAAQMVELLKKGSTEIQGLTEDYRALNGVISEGEAKAMKEANAKLKDLTTSAGSLSRELTLLLSGPATGMIQWLTDLANSTRKAFAQFRKNSISDEMNDLNEKLAKNIKIVKDWDGRGGEWQEWADNAKRRIEEIKVQIGELRDETSDLLVPDGARAGYINDGMDDHVKTWRDAQTQEAQSNFVGGTKEDAEKAEKDRLAQIWKAEKKIRDTKLMFLNLAFKDQQQYEDKKNREIKAGQNATLNATASFLGLLGQKNKKFAVAEAVMNAALGAVRTWNAYPFPWNIAPTALHIAQGAANVSAVKSGGGVSAPGGGASVPDIPSTQGTEDLAAANDEPQTTKTITVAFEGEGELLPRSVLRELADELNSLDDSNVRISV